MVNHVQNICFDYQLFENEVTKLCQLFENEFANVFFDKVVHQALNGQTNVQQTQLTNKNENVGNRYTFSQIPSTVPES